VIRHLTPTDFRRQPWANGKGSTLELAREDREGAMLWRLSRASVVENGPFSLFPGIERNLTVLTGPGFDLVGPGLHLAARPLVPVAFAGDVALSAQNVTAPSDDFNVMTARSLPRPQVQVVTRATLPPAPLLAIYALAQTTVNGQPLPADHLILTDEAAQITGQALTIRLTPS
jgi:uncharacterized protein